MAMSFPFEHTSLWFMLGLGILFGFFLEAGGLGSPRKLTAQLDMRDWAVFKVMFTAIVMAAVGLLVSDQVGLLAAVQVKVQTPFYWSMAAGGALLGIGMALGGYCPGTSVVGLLTGRLDALFFIVGMMGGVLLFANYCEALQGLFFAGMGKERETLASLSGLPGWLIVFGLAVLAWAGFRLGTRFESREGGVIDARDLADD
jgi:uncharacterized protein